MTRNFNVTLKIMEQNLMVRSVKSEAEVTKNKRLRSRHCTVEAAEGHKASRGLSTTAELLVFWIIAFAGRVEESWYSMTWQNVCRFECSFIDIAAWNANYCVAVACGQCQRRQTYWASNCLTVADRLIVNFRPQNVTKCWGLRDRRSKLMTKSYCGEKKLSNVQMTNIFIRFARETGSNRNGT